MSDLISRQDVIKAVLGSNFSACTVYGRSEEGMATAKELIQAIKNLPSAQPEIVRCKNCKYNYGLATGEGFYAHDIVCSYFDTDGMDENDYCSIGVPSAQPTLYGYDIEHLELIANVLRKENLPPERIAEVLTDIGRIVSMVRDEFEETLRKAVERCMI